MADPHTTIQSRESQDANRLSPLSRDTSLEAEQVQIELLRHASPARRFALSQAMTSTVLALQRRALRDLNPAADDRELQRLALKLNYGADIAERVGSHLEARKM